MMEQAGYVKAAELLRHATRVTVFSGAGISAESGVATFRGAGGLWEGYRAEDVATPEAFAADPEMVWRFYEARRRTAGSVRPNPAHDVIARWQDRFAALAVVTQNVDGLHRAAGSRDVLELHGSLWKIRCSECGREEETRIVPLPEVPPRCPECRGIGRPGVVWFGEVLPQGTFNAAVEAASAAEVMLVVGTSAAVYPAAGLVEIAARGGAALIEVNPEPSALAYLATVALRGPAGEVLPTVDALLEV